MDKLIVTVTCDSSMSYPDNPYCPPIENVKAFADEYVRSVNAGASICHVHGVHHLEEKLQPDGRKLSTIDHAGWQELNDRIKEKVNPLMQYGIASARMDDKIKLMDQKPDMMCYAFNAHDEWFQPDPNKPAKEIYALHPRDELRTFLQACKDKNVKPEVECFHTGAFFNLQALIKENLFKDKIWTTLFFWPGGTWTPPTPRSLINFVDHLPDNCNYNVSSMDYNPTVNWRLLTQVIMMGGHVRVGFEDNPYLAPGVYAKSNAELVEKIVRIAREVGREIATPDEARQIIKGQ